MDGMGLWMRLERSRNLQVYYLAVRWIIRKLCRLFLYRRICFDHFFFLLILKDLYKTFTLFNYCEI